MSKPKGRCNTRQLKVSGFVPDLTFGRCSPVNIVCMTRAEAVRAGSEFNTTNDEQCIRGYLNRVLKVGSCLDGRG